MYDGALPEILWVGRTLLSADGSRRCEWPVWRDSFPFIVEMEGAKRLTTEKQSLSSSAEASSKLRFSCEIAGILQLSSSNTTEVRHTTIKLTSKGQ